MILLFVCPKYILAKTIQPNNFSLASNANRGLIILIATTSKIHFIIDFVKLKHE
jgi:hypothetical protein